MDQVFSLRPFIYRYKYSCHGDGGYGNVNKLTIKLRIVFLALSNTFPLRTT
jgi:hypothetical protein